MQTTETSHKAWAGATGVVLAYAIARLTGVVEGAPPWEDVAAAIRTLGEAACAAVVGYFTVWFGPRNEPKP